MSQSSSVVGRVVAVLWTLAEQDRPATLQQIARRCGLPASTTHRLLRQLQKLGMATQTADRRYQPGIDLFYMGAVVTSRSLVMEAVRPLIREVIARTQRTCLLSLYVPARRGRVLVAHIHPNEPLPPRFQLNLHRDLVWGSTGRAILAYLDKHHIEQAVDRAPPSPARGQAPPDIATIWRWLEQVRAQGFALSQGEVSPTGTAVAVPLFGSAGTVVGSIAVTEEHCTWKAATRDRLANILIDQSAGFPALLAAQNGPKERKPLKPFH
jgi:DNA-binding IclR family transcriptional regulator